MSAAYSAGDWTDFGSQRPLPVGRIGPAAVNAGCLAVAGGTLLAQAGGGLYWLIPSVLVAFMCGLLNVWVLMVEILR